MELDEKVELLKSSPIFALLTEEQLRLIAEKITHQTLPAGTIFIEQDTVTNTAYLIIRGAIKVYRISENGEEVMLDTKGKGELVGEMALLDGKPRSAYVETITESTFFCLTKSSFFEIIQQNPQISLNIIRHFVLQTREFNERMEEIISKNLTDRTLNTLKTLANYFSNNDITLSQEQIASIIGATRARVTESLNTLEERGTITLSHKKIHLN